MPALLGLYAIRLFPIARNLKKIHACVCILMLGIAAVAGTELFSGTNLLPWTGAVEEWVQTSRFQNHSRRWPFRKLRRSLSCWNFGIFSHHLSSASYRRVTYE